MRAIDIIRSKRDGEVLGREAIQAVVRGVTDGSWPDYQITAFLMAVVLRGMTLEEATALTEAMVDSGQRLDWSSAVSPPAIGAVDKHSTGGVGDKTSLILAPLAAACGAVVPMMSGRGLGHTGGTLDKLSAIPGFRTDLSVDEMRRIVDKTGCVLIRPTDDVAPADRRMYALRDASGTVESVPLIAGSILSKKIAEGIGALVLDVKVGSGGFMPTIERARELASWLVAIAEKSGVRTEAMLTRMDVPLGRRVGNASEVLESIQVLRGEGPADIEAVSVALTARMLVLAGIAPAGEAEARVRQALTSGRGLQKFGEMIEAQGGDPGVLDHPERLELSDRAVLLCAERPGIFATCDAGLIGQAAVALGAGRDKIDDVVDLGVGIDVMAEIGATVQVGDPLLRVYYRDPRRLEMATMLLTAAIRVEDEPAAGLPLFIDTIDRTTASLAVV
ncbi:MAG: thymidine phosphorylase [Vicinamibacterales bacterium]